MGKHLPERLARMAFGNQRSDLDIGMPRGKPDHIAAGIARGAKNGRSDDLFRHGLHCHTPSYRRKPVSSE
jgi:hypothetical protein